MLDSVLKFESKIAKFFGAPYAVAVDCCTHGVELSIRLTNPLVVSCPKNTYLSIPMLFNKLAYGYNFTDEKWREYYYITSKVIDAAVLWRQDSYVSNTLMSISFQHKKHLKLGRGGMILCSTLEEYLALKSMSYDGRDLSIVPWTKENITTIGYHYYMTLETAQLGLEKLPIAIQTLAALGSYVDYPNISAMSVFNGNK
jgi:dTDP-4-amino-4,6-dideoxygalactose transaminase